MVFIYYLFLGIGEWYMKKGLNFTQILFNYAYKDSWVLVFVIINATTGL